MSSVTSAHFKREIEYNLSIMEKTFSEGREIDQGFFKIFQEDITQLAALQTKEKIEPAVSTPVIKELNDRLQKNTLKLQEIVKGIFKPIEANNTALVASSLLNAGEIALTQSNEILKAGFEVLNQNGLQVRKVAPDGHCQLRSIAAKILIDNQRQKKKSKSKLLTLAEAAVKNETYTAETKEIAKKVVAGLNPKKNQSALEILQNQELSDLLVQFLRLIAVEGLRKNKSETFTQMLERDGIPFEQYCKDMTSMPLAKFGGQPEIMELEKALKTPLQFLDLSILGKGKQLSASTGTNETMKVLTKEELTPGKTFILYNPTGLHYDLAEIPVV